MNSDQGSAIIERLVFGVAMTIALKLGTIFGFDNDTATWLAGGAVTAVFGIIAFFKSRPQSLLSRAANVLPNNINLELKPNSSATTSQKSSADQMAELSNSKVTAAR